MKEAIIQTVGLTKIFRNVIAVDQLNLCVTPGIYGFLGPNGAGKTTTIKMLIGSLFPTSGEIEILGHNIAREDKMDIHKWIGYVPERPTYFMHMTGEQFLETNGRIFHLPKQENKAKVAALLKKVDLVEAKDRKIAEYSAGMKQRIGIAQALMNDPRLLILDEITSNLDPIGRNEMVDLLKDLRTEVKTIFVSTHILSEVQKMNADAIGIIDHGHLIIEGGPDALNEKWGVKTIRITPNHAAFRDAISSDTKNLSEDGNSLVVEADDEEIIWEKIAQVSLEQKIPVTEFRAAGMEIEQLFMKAINSEKNDTRDAET